MARLEIKPSKADLPVFENLEDLYRTTRWRGYYGGIRIIQALIVRLIDYCREQGIELENRNFTLEYESNIPQRLGLGGSSAIITASLRAFCQYYHLEIPLPVQANLALETETKELNVPAGLQDRVIQAYQGLVYMDFSRDLMESRGYGEYERMDPGLPAECVRGMPDLTQRRHRSISWQPARALASPRSGSRGGHDTVGRVTPNRDATCLLQRNYERLNELVDANFDLRARIYRIDRATWSWFIRPAAGATANFAGSGGAIVGTYDDEAMFRLTAR